MGARAPLLEQVVYTPRRYVVWKGCRDKDTGRLRITKPVTCSWMPEWSRWAACIQGQHYSMVVNVPPNFIPAGSPQASYLSLLSALLVIAQISYSINPSRPTSSDTCLFLCAWLVDFAGKPSGHTMRPGERLVHDRVIAELKTCVGEEGHAAAWAEGQTQGFDRACSLVEERE